MLLFRVTIHNTFIVKLSKNKLWATFVLLFILAVVSKLVWMGVSVILAIGCAFSDCSSNLPVGLSLLYFLPIILYVIAIVTGIRAVIFSHKKVGARVLYSFLVVIATLAMFYVQYSGEIKDEIKIRAELKQLEKERVEGERINFKNSLNVRINAADICTVILKAEEPICKNGEVYNVYLRTQIPVSKEGEFDDFEPGVIGLQSRVVNGKLQSTEGTQIENSEVDVTISDLSPNRPYFVHVYAYAKLAQCQEACYYRIAESPSDVTVQFKEFESKSISVDLRAITPVIGNTGLTAYDAKNISF